MEANSCKCPVMLASSVQASLSGRYAGSEYGKSKRNGERLFFDYAEETGAEVFVFRFPNVFGKWCRPNYNSAVATFCYDIANDLPITVDDRNTVLELAYIDDVIDSLIALLRGETDRCDYDGATPIPNGNGKFCRVGVTHKVSLGEIVDLLNGFAKQPATLQMPEIPCGSFEKNFIRLIFRIYRKKKSNLFRGQTKMLEEVLRN